MQKFLEKIKNNFIVKAEAHSAHRLSECAHRLSANYT